MTLMLGAAAFGYLVSEGLARQSLAERANARLDVLIAEIDGILSSGSNLPSALVLNEDLLALLRSGEGARARSEPANLFLEALNNHLGSLTSFIVDRHGVVVASSDWGLSENLVGRDLSQQPFFRMALNGTRYGYYATDPARNEPGFYFSQPVLDEKQGWRIVGVAVVKVSLNDLQRRWLNHELPVLVADPDGVVILSTVPEWRYTVLDPGPAVRSGEAGSFDGRTLRPFPVALDGIGSGIGRQVSVRLSQDTLPVSAGLRDYFALGRNMPGTGWQLVVFSDYAALRRQAIGSAAFSALLCGALLLLGMYAAQRRRLGRLQREAQRLLEAANQDLESRVAARTADLTAVNTRLRQEIAERIRAEQTLRAAQDELVQAAKLAVLGRMAAGITHELNQPLGAIRTLSANAVAYMRRGDLATAGSNLEIVARQIDQMARIIGPLKSFARKSPAHRLPVDISHAVDAALFLYAKRFTEEGVHLDNRCAAGEAVALCDANRLEQVLVNLIGNALDALRGCPSPVLRVAARCGDGEVLVELADNGPGLSGEVSEHLFEPFFTTKTAGEGLGLGLAISRDIVREFGGELEAGNNPQGGAVFTIRLPARSR